MLPLYVLVDLPNSDIARTLHRPNPAIIEGRLVSALEEVLARIQGHTASSFLEFAVRLYDGWFHHDGTPTELYEMVRRAVRTAYPRRTRSARINVVVATSLLALPDFRIVETLRFGRGLGRYNVRIESPPAACSRSHTECATRHLKRWFASGCPEPDCSVDAAAVASFKYQKLVDTALVADAVWLSTEARPLCIVSSDEDMLPGVVTAAGFGTQVLWAVGPLPVKAHYQPLLLASGVEVI